MAKYVIPSNANAEHEMHKIAARIKDGDTIIIPTNLLRAKFEQIMRMLGKSNVFYFVEVRK